MTFRFTGNKNAVRVALVILILLMVLFTYLSWNDAEAQGLYADLPYHFSTGGSTEINTSRNLVNVGYELPDGLQVSAGGFFIGSEYCQWSLTLGQRIGEHWIATLSTNGDNVCTIGGQKWDIPANVGFGIIRTARWNRFEIGFGAGLWEHGDRAIGRSPLEQDTDLQLAVGILVRIHAKAR